MEHITYIASLLNFEGNSELPAWVHIMPAGTFMADDGRGPWHLKNPKDVIKASIRPKVDMVIDRDHELVLAPGGKHIAAAGWVKDIEFREDGLWARVEWTANAIKQILAKEYRYISPVFNLNKAGEVTKIHHISLVNEPALELTAVASKILNFNTTPPEKKDKTMDEKQALTAIARILGLDDSNDIEKVVEAAKSNKNSLTELKTEIASVKTALGLDGDADNKEVIATASKKIATNQPDPGEYVPMSVFKETQQTLASMQKDTANDKAEQAVTAAVKSGRVTPGQKDWAMNYASKDLDGFNKFVEASPKIVTDGKKDGLETASKKSSSAAHLSAEDVAVAKMMGVNPDTLKDVDTE